MTPSNRGETIDTGPGEDSPRRVPFDRAFRVASDRGKRIKQKNYLTLGRWPIVDQGKEFFAGYTDDPNLVYEGELPVIVFGDHTRRVKLVKEPFAIGADGVKLLQPAPSWESDYLYYHLEAEPPEDRGYGRHFQYLRKQLFLWRSPGSQLAVVAELGLQFSRLDAGIAALKRAQANLKRYRASVLQAACEGRLVPTEHALAQAEGRDYETGEQLLQRILTVRRQSWTGKGKYKEPAQPETTGENELPPGWTWASPAELSSGCSHSLAIGPFGSNLKVSDYTQTGVPLVFVRNIRTGRFRDAKSQYVSPNKAAALRAHRCTAGDILITKMGEPPGEATKYPETEPDAVITADCIKWTPSELITEATLIAYFVNSQAFRDRILKITKGVAQQKVNLGRFSTLAFPLPPVVEQARIVAEVERRLSVVDQLEKTITANLSRATRLRQAILKKAFSPVAATSERQ